MLNLIGEKYGKLKVIKEAEPDIKITPKRKRVTRRWECKCECGNVCTVNHGDLRSGKTISCGCHRNKKLVERVYKHGMADKVPEYTVWQSMKDRCYNKNSSGYSDYGRRGIKVCPAWISDFKQFYNDMGQRPDETYTLERINNNGDYSPNNCTWATRSEQRLNQRIRSNNKTGYMNVHETEYNTFVAQITRDNVHHYLGSYKTIQEAVEAVERFKTKQTQ